MATLATLKADIAAWMKRGDLTAAIPSFVSLAETEIFRTHDTPLRVREMETTATLTVTSLKATVPADFLEGRMVKASNGNLMFYCPPSEWNQDKAGFFTVIGYEISLPTGCTGNITLVYWAKPAALTSDADTNAILNAYYGIYLNAAVKYAMMYCKADASSAQSLLNMLMVNAKSKPIVAGSLQVRPA